jgi:hypothetical protein
VTKVVGVRVPPPAPAGRFLQNLSPKLGAYAGNGEVVWSAKWAEKSSADGSD